MPRISVGFINQGIRSGRELLIVNGPTLQVDIGFDPHYDAAVGGVPVPGARNQPALLDSGATASCIDIQLAQSLNLPMVDKQPMAGINGKMLAEMYMAQVHIPTLNYTIYGQFAGVRLQEGGMLQPVLIGRTFLQDFQMVYDGPSGRVTLEID